MASRYGECYLCGRHAMLTKDHLPPKCFFARPRPSNLITVGSCERCNNQASQDDEKARLIIAFSAPWSKSPEGRALLTETIEFLRTKRPKMLKRLQESVMPVDIGQGHKFAMGIALEAEPFERVFERIARGLYFREKGHRLPDNVELTVIRFKWDEHYPVKFQGTQSVDIGPMTLVWDFAHDSPYAAVWRFEFYKVEHVTVFCRPNREAAG
jgi:hypothetical protein